MDWGTHRTDRWYKLQAQLPELPDQQIYGFKGDVEEQSFTCNLEQGLMSFLRRTGQLGNESEGSQEPMTLLKDTQ